MENEESHPIDVSPGHLDLSEGDEVNLTVVDSDDSAGPLSESIHYVTEASSGPKESIIQGVSKTKYDFFSWLSYLNSTNGTDAEFDYLLEDPEDPEKARIKFWLIVCVGLIVTIMITAYAFKRFKNAWRSWPRSPLRRRLGALFPNWFPEISDDPLLEPQKANIAHASTGTNSDENEGTREVKKIGQEAAQIEPEEKSKEVVQTKVSEAAIVAVIDDNQHVTLEEAKKDVQEIAQTDAHSPAKKDAQAGATDDAQQVTMGETSDNAQAESHPPAEKDAQEGATDAQQVTQAEATDDAQQVVQAEAHPSAKKDAQAEATDDAQEVTKEEAVDNAQAEAHPPAKKDAQAEATDDAQVTKAEAADNAQADAQQVVQAGTS